MRDPELYFVTIFGKPLGPRQVGLEDRGASPLAQLRARRRQDRRGHAGLLRRQPAEVRQGPRQGLRTLADREDRALRLVQALDRRPAQEGDLRREGSRRKSARPTRPNRRPTPAVGIAYAELNGDQRAMLRALVESYAADMPIEVAKAWLDEIASAGTDAVRFAWAGPADRSQGHAYRVQGPTFLIEFNNTQNDANHIHSVWRNMLGDFGIPLKPK